MARGDRRRPARIQRIGVPEGSTRLDASDNFWSTGGPGPCGPCSELNYDRGPEWGGEGGPVVNGERYLEYYNLVFMQSEQDADGNMLGDLPARNVDTGLGPRAHGGPAPGRPGRVRDRPVQAVDRARRAAAGVTYGAPAGAGTDAERDVSLRVIAEHARTAAFLIADGVLPSKEGRGYVLRRLMRRAVRHGQLLGMDLAGGAELLRPDARDGHRRERAMYPELTSQRELITRVAGAEERDFAPGCARASNASTTAVEQVGRPPATFPGGRRRSNCTTPSGSRST